MKHLPAFYVHLACLISLFACQPRSFSEEEHAAYQHFVERLQAEEPYIGFFAAEKAYIPDRTEAYLHARKICFLGIKNSEEEPYEFVEDFVDFCEKQDLLAESDKEAWEKVLTILSFELYQNKPIFDFTTDQTIAHRSLVFAEYPNKQLALDLFLPKVPLSDPMPVVICIHGGGWMVNRRIWFEPFAQYLAHHGIAAATIDYRMLPAVTIKECVFDSKAAVRWIRAHAPQYHIDPERIGLIGASAGGQLVALLGASANEPELEGDGGNAGVSSEVQAVVGIATPSFNLHSDKGFMEYMDIEESLIRFLSPYEHIDSTSAPTLLIQGTIDEVVPPHNAQELHDKLKNHGVHTELIWIEGEGHGFYEGNDRAINMATKFFKKIL
ncbi:MAG: alpha/beta hydrolase [Bacteroidota bacterium]